MEGVDYSGSRPSGQCLYGAGKRFAGRYFGPGGAWKHATRAEVAMLAAAGLWVVTLAEGNEQDPLQGNAMGVTHATLANNAALAAGMPSHRPIYFAVDWDMTTAQRPAVEAYLRGCASVIGPGRVGVYGGLRTVAWARGASLAAWSFQTYAWSGGVWYPRNHIEQYRNGQSVCGAAVDLCRSKQSDFGQWRPGVQTIGAAPESAANDTVVTPWEFVDMITRLANQVGGVGVTLDATAQQIERI